ncbi:MAG TPA: hypothetical protein ENJ57_06665 [Rhizobiales bacterium]|nr:hypothetical protein [Hyphomicrobiales bacterium]
MSKIVKVCVRVPSNRKDCLLAYAKGLREQDSEFVLRTPGWDAKIIHKIAKEKYGSLLGMFEKHGWTERGSDMMRFVQTRVKETYGSAENFLRNHSE